MTTTLETLRELKALVGKIKQGRLIDIVIADENDTFGPLFGEDGLDAHDAREFVARADELIDFAVEAHEILSEFCERRDAGKIHSTYTYNRAAKLLGDREGSE